MLLATEKFVLRRILNFIRRRGRNLRSLLIIGAGKIGRQFYSEIITNQHFGYKLLGFVDDRIQADMNGEYAGPISELDTILESKNVDDVIIALPNYAFSKIKEVITICEKYPIKVRLIPDYFQFISDKYSVSMFGSFPVITTRDHRINEFQWRILKRIFDITFSLFCFLLFFSWLFPLVTLFIKLDSKGPVLFKQERWGRNNKRFSAYKFRSMVCGGKDIDENGKYKQALKNDPRLTRVGKFLRKTNLDELPQFINVLKGELSIVGPRPHPTPLNLESREYINKYMRRHIVKPGITGWAQVNGFRGETTSNKKLMLKRVEYDLWYIENWSFLLDIQIIILTIWLMIKGDPNAY
jgi:putative colanic acid biosynthesis UDP-glucose lipid carrier transferase